MSTVLRNVIRGKLFCWKCGRSVGCTADEMIHYAQTGWPHCCHETMTLNTPGDKGCLPNGTPLPDDCLPQHFD